MDKTYPPRALPRHLWPNGHLANTLVLPSATSTYARILKIIESGQVPACSAGATMDECVKYEAISSTGEYGIMVPINWLR